MTDGQLIECFVGNKDETCFSTLVERHGPRVLRVCRRVLTKPDDVEDAYQATFLVLIQKAPTLRDTSALGNWLHGVAHRVSIQLRRDLARRHKYERMRAESGPPSRDGERAWDDSVQTVREELGTLPDAYRVPLELCYLRGQSHEQAASTLGWPLGTLKTRVLRGRRRLQDRLTRRGIAIGAWLLLLLFRREARAAPVDPHQPGGPGAAPADPGRTPETISPAEGPRPGVGGIAGLVRWAAANPLWVVLLGLLVALAATQLPEMLAPVVVLCG